MEEISLYHVRERIERALAEELMVQHMDVMHCACDESVLELFSQEYLSRLRAEFPLDAGTGMGLMRVDGDNARLLRIMHTGERPI